MALIFETCILILGIVISDAYKILGIFPYPAFSHQQPLHAVTLALSQKGHDVTVITTHPVENPPANYKQLNVSFIGAELSKTLPRKSINEKRTLEQLAYWKNFLIMNCDILLGSEVVQDFLKSNDSDGFDAVIVESVAYGCFHGLVRHMGSPPIIGVMSTMMQTQNYLAAGSVYNPSYMAHTQLPVTDHLTFLQRLRNVLITLAFTYFWDYILLPNHETVSSNYFGENSVSIHADDRNVNLLISNCHWLFSYPQPYNPNILCISGSHIKKDTSPIPKKIQTFIENSREGFVYVSLGCQIQNSDLTETLDASFIHAFGNLKLKVLWKNENENITNLPRNVMTAKWLPQQDILAHRNVKLFVTQGGIQSCQEALYHAVPMLVIPFTVDQPYNAANVVAKGLGETIFLSNIHNETLEAAMNSILNNKSYEINARRYSSQFKEHLEKSLDQGAWWIEYVVRHRGANHLRSASHSLDNVRGYLLDVIAAVVSGIVVACFAVFKLINMIRVTKRSIAGNGSKSS